MVEPIRDMDGEVTTSPVRRPLPPLPAARRPAPGPGTPVEARKRPDPRPMRIAYGAGALAALSVMSVGLVRQAPSTATTSQVIAADTTTPARAVEIQHRIRYVHLKPGQVAPAGAKVITPDAPAPQVVVTHLAAPAPPVRRVVVTRQSGHP